MGLGLSWISLDSLVRIETFQWVARLEARKSFSRALSVRLRVAGTEAYGRGHVEGPDCSSGKLNPVSDFLQEIVIRGVPFRPTQSKSNSLQDRDDEVVDEIIERKCAVVRPTKRCVDRWAKRKNGPRSSLSY
jgi:hypothetical protein